MKSVSYKNLKNRRIKGRSLDISNVDNYEDTKSLNIKIIPEKSWLKKYEMIKILGEGSFGITYLAYDKKLKQRVAIKIINTETEKNNKIDINNSLKELGSLYNLARKGLYDLDNDGCHPYISCYYDGFISKFENQECIFIISEYVNGVELYDFIDLFIKQKTPLEPYLLWSMMYQMVEAIIYIHNKGYAHRDIKLENIIIEDKTNVLKLIDFGFACFKNDCFAGPGTKYYAPPELFSLNRLNGLEAAQAHDIWSLGIVFYILANLEYPYDNIKMIENGEELFKSNYEPSISIDIKFIKIINLIIDDMLNLDWNERIKPCYILNTLNRLGKFFSYDDLSEYYNKYC